jgi:large subunit ribosomal protein L23
MTKLHKYSILRRPIVTEKSTLLQEERRYVFEVAPSATKLEIKDAVESVFGVNVKKVNTMNVRGKKKRFGPKMSQLRSWKKAIITVSPGETITLFEGV